ncbi:MAG: hypothetical protein LGB73_00490 [Sulfurovum sp.]|nr:hypothetical protein [Sulfurovum sp.]
MMHKKLLITLCMTTTQLIYGGGDFYTNVPADNNIRSIPDNEWDIVTAAPLVNVNNDTTKANVATEADIQQVDTTEADKVVTEVPIPVKKKKSVIPKKPTNQDDHDVKLLEELGELGLLGQRNNTLGNEKDSNPLKVALKFGTLGVGVDLFRMYTKQTGLRFNLNGLSFDQKITLLDNSANGGPATITNEGVINLFSAGVLADYYLGDSNFRGSIGAYYNKNRFNGILAAGNGLTLSLNGRSYDRSALDRYEVDIKSNASLSMYVGIGWGDKNPCYRGECDRWYLTLEVGALRQPVRVDASAKANNAALEAEIRQNLEVERQKIADEFSKYQWWPVIMVGITRQF